VTEFAGAALGRVLEPGPAGRCDDLRVGGAVVRWVAARGRWHLWYYCRDRSFPTDVAETLGSGRIALATSLDGTHWTRFDGPGTGGSIFEPGTAPDDFDSTHVGSGDVSQVDGRWYLWYFGGDRQIGFSHRPGQMGYRMRAGLAVSDDGIAFRRLRGAAPGGAAVDFDGNAFAAWPNGIHDGEQFVLYYTTLEAPGKEFVTRTARSRDGMHWNPQGPISWLDETPPHESHGIMTRHVLENPLRGGLKWLMVYTAMAGPPGLKRSICAAESADGVRWRRLFRTPIFDVGSPGAWDDGGVASPQLVVAGTELRMYYFGFPLPRPDAPAKGIGLAVSRSGDLRHLERISADPAGR
jgi:hypothetical protein